MATGDNILTAMSVARQCKIIDENKTTFMGELVESDGAEPQIKWTNVSKAAKNKDECPEPDIMNLNFDEAKNNMNRVQPASPRDASANGGLPFNYRDSSVELAISGKLMRHLYTNRTKDGWSFRAVLARANVFARMAPDDKAMLVASFQSALLDQKIGMCGDGANDCAALKQADVGVSLSQAEASIAAPFTCSVQNIECVPNLLREGKASLATSFQIAKFTISYAMI
jgi:cation-transporting ATPase 13A3/4/5